MDKNDLIAAPPLTIDSGPMSESGLMIDPVTGRPPGPEAQTAEEVSAVKRAAKVFEDTNALIADLSGEGGVVVRFITDCLARRIGELVQADPECTAYLHVLSKIKYKINVGSVVAEHYAKLDIKPVPAP
jgi:hypothetical protein